MVAAAIAEALNGRRSGSGYTLRCVAHNDRTPSLSIADGADGRLLVRCHAGCNSLDILAALHRLGLTSGSRRDGTLRPPGLNFRGGESKVVMEVAISSPTMASILARAVPIH